MRNCVREAREARGVRSGGVGGCEKARGEEGGWRSAILRTLNSLTAMASAAHRMKESFGSQRRHFGVDSWGAGGGGVGRFLVKGAASGGSMGSIPG